MRGAFLKIKDYDIEEIKLILNKGFDFFGGLNKYFDQNDRILLKPNFLAADPPEKATNTHPIFIEAVIQIFLDSGYKNLFIGDSPAVSSGKSVARFLGIIELIERYKIGFVELKTPYGISNKSGKLIKYFEISKEIFDFNKIVNLPKLKNHSLTIFTGAMKNIFGVIPGKLKALWHARLKELDNFSNMIVDLYDLINPTFNIMDGIIGMEGEGPRGGKPINTGCVIMSDSGFLTDLIATYYIGYKPEKMPIIKHYAVKHNLSLNIKDYKVYGDPIEIFRKFERLEYRENINIVSNNRIFRVLSDFFKQITSPKPVIINSSCKKCGLCYEVCPTNPKSINWEAGKIPVYDYSNCIRCFCCQEICPYSAITIKYPGFWEFLKKI